MGGAATGAGIGAIAGGIGGYAAAQKTGKSSDKALRGDINDAYYDLESIILPYEDLVRLGRVTPHGVPRTKPGLGQGGIFGGPATGEGVPEYSTLRPGESRLSRALVGYEQGLLNANPYMQDVKGIVTSGLQGIQNGGIPDDVRRTILENVRSSFAARGIEESPVAAVEEAVRLYGGTEQIRSTRLAEAQNYFNQVTAPAIEAFTPTLSNIYGNELQRSIEKSRGRRDAGQVGAAVAG